VKRWRKPSAAHRGAGSRRCALAVAPGFGWWPQVKPAFWSIVLFRWDINVRESAVLGLVGAGGIGMALDTAMNLFQWDRVAMVLFAIFAVVVLAELVVTQIRKRIL
jgi:phosphonate transport system permease protein